MPDMSAQSLEQFYIDLDAENHRRDGVVIDVRNNNGGFVNVYAIDVLARRSYFDMTQRGAASAAPARSVLGQRALERPTILLANQHSLSDAEDFTEGYRALKLGRWSATHSLDHLHLEHGAGGRIDPAAARAHHGGGRADMEMRPRPASRLAPSARTRRDDSRSGRRELLAQIGRQSSQQ
jgi:hypothetical protein